ncbi:MAG: hypothetical protein OXE78_06805 [Gammaproteobacteria bacterium]|nr:hypothetical protein [Gammaproteobacteria bacterium]
MPSSARVIVEGVLPRQMVNYIWSANYDKALPITHNDFELSAILPAVFYMFRFGQRRGPGNFLKTFASGGGTIQKQRSEATVSKVGNTLASSPCFTGFNDSVKKAILGDLLLCFCLENIRHDLGRDKQIQRVAPAHYMASWVDLPLKSAHLRFAPEMMVAMLANQKGETVTPEASSKRTWFAVAAESPEDNLLLKAFSQGMDRSRLVANLVGDHFLENDESVGLDQLLMVRLAQQLESAPQKLRGESTISNQRPIAEQASRNFSDDIRRFIRAYAEVIPRQTFLDLLEACVATGMTNILTSVVNVLLKWSETGNIIERQQQQPADILVDCSNGLDSQLRGLAERSMDDLMRRIEKIPVILMILRLLDHAATNNKKIDKSAIQFHPYATEWLELLGDILYERHSEASKISLRMEVYGEDLATALRDDYPDAADLLQNEQGQRNPVWRLARALTPLMGTNARRNTIGMVDSTLNIEKPNGLARKRNTTRGSHSTRNRRQMRQARSIVFTDPVLDYLVHLHLLPAGNKPNVRPISLREFLTQIRERYGFHVDEAPPGMSVSNDLLRENRTILERRLRDLGLLVGVNDAEAMKRLQPRFNPIRRD